MASRKTFHEARCGFVSVVHGKAPQEKSRKFAPKSIPGSARWLKTGMSWATPNQPISTHVNQHRRTTVSRSMKLPGFFFASSHSDPSATRGRNHSVAQFEELFHSKDATKRLKLDMMLKMRRCAKLLMLAKRRFPRRAFTPETRKMGSFSCSRM